MTAAMALAILAAVVLFVGAAVLVRRGLTTPRLHSSQKQLRRIRQARQRKAQDVRNQQVQYLIDHGKEEEDR